MNDKRGGIVAPNSLSYLSASQLLSFCLLIGCGETKSAPAAAQAEKAQSTPTALVTAAATIPSNYTGPRPPTDGTCGVSGSSQLPELTIDHSNGAHFTVPEPLFKDLLVATAARHGQVIPLTFGEVLYFPNQGYTGDDSFTYQGKDISGNSLPVATYTLHITNSTPPAVVASGTFEVAVKPSSLTTVSSGTLDISTYVPANSLFDKTNGKVFFENLGYQSSSPNTWLYDVYAHTGGTNTAHVLFYAPGCDAEGSKWASWGTVAVTAK